MALFDFVKDIAGIAGAATGVAGMLGLGRDSGSKETRRLAQRQAAIAEALADPNSPMFQQARQQAMEQSRTAQLQALRDYMTAQQRQARRFSRQGNVSMYAMNPRRDEAISRQLASMARMRLRGLILRRGSSLPVRHKGSGQRHRAWDMLLRLVGVRMLLACLA